MENIDYKIKAHNVMFIFRSVLIYNAKCIAYNYKWQEKDFWNTAKLLNNTAVEKISNCIAYLTFTVYKIIPNL